MLILTLLYNSSSKVAIPYLKKSSNPHILMNSPPISLNPFWFKQHVAYTVAKYNMSLYALGLAAELREFGIGVNTIWPKTGINYFSVLFSNNPFI
jgi:citronellol/citronellal dehydrogenase